MSQSKTAPTSSKSPYQVQVLDRALAVLDLLSNHGPDLTLAQLSATLKLHKSTVHRVVMVLERNGLIDKNSESGKYRLGLKLFELGTRAVGQLDLREHARPFLERAVLESGETVHLCVYDGGDVVYLDKVEPERSVRLACTVGRRNPAYCTAVGKAMMAFLPEAQVEAEASKYGFRQLTKNTITNILDLRAELAKVRQRGYAVDDEEIEEGVRCVGAPVWGFGKYPVAAISVSGPAFRVTLARVPAIAQLITTATNALSKQLGMNIPSAISREDGHKGFHTQVIGA